MDIDNFDNYNDVRGRYHFFSNVSSRSTSVISKASSIPYYKKMVINNDFSNEEFMKPVDSSQLSYNSNDQERNHISMVTNTIFS